MPPDGLPRGRNHPTTGNIAHTHRVITLKGGTRTSEPEIEARTRETAKQLGRDRDRPALEVLHLSAEAMREPGIYAVDSERRSVVLTEHPERHL
jgi:hypothetical protein